MVFQIAQKVSKYLGCSCNTICCQSGHTVCANQHLQGKHRTTFWCRQPFTLEHTFPSRRSRPGDANQQQNSKYKESCSQKPNEAGIAYIYLPTYVNIPTYLCLHTNLPIFTKLYLINYLYLHTNLPIFT